jgi:dTDP-4-dehydrorhamnose reductase
MNRANKILITGITGQVGQELTDTLKGSGELFCLARQQMDLADADSIRNAIRAIQPNIIVNPAAYTAVDKAETEISLATAINSNAPRIIAEEAEKINATVIHISTDYVFDGTKNTPYLPEDRTNPIGIYGKTKLMGEIGIRENCTRHLIVRTAWVYGVRGHGNFVKTMLKLGAGREELKVVADQIGSPTRSTDIATTIASLIEKVDRQECPWGIYHFTNSGVASWYDLAVTIFEEAKAKQLSFPLKIQRVIPITTAEYPTPAQRPAYSVLSNQKLDRLLGTNPPHWRHSLQQMLLELSRSIVKPVS